jgi:Acetyltransferase (GNAT) domain
MEIEEVLDTEKWDEFIRDTWDGTIFHTSSWFKLSPHNFLRLGVSEKGRILAGAILQVNENGFGVLGTLAPYMGPVFSKSIGDKINPEIKRRVTSILLNAIRGKVPKSTFFTSPWIESLQQFVCMGFEAKLLYTSVVSTTDLEQTQARFSPVLRRNIKAALKVGLTVEQSSDPSELLDLVRQSFVRQGHPIWFSLEEADSCMRHLAKLGQARCFITRNQEGFPIAASGIVWDWHRSYYILGGYDHIRAHRGGSSLALWSAIQFTHQNLCLTEIDLEGSHHPAIERFFRQFGGYWRPFYHVAEATHSFLNMEEA